MLCSSTSHPRYATSSAASSGAGYLIHPPYQPDGGLHHHQRIDYSFSNSAAPDGGQVDYVQDQCSIHSSATLIFTHPTGSGGAVPQPRKFWDQASASAPDSAGQSKSSHPRTASGRAFGRSSGGPAAGATSKKRKRVATVAQRRAANVRERRRMFNLNEAFDKLRRKVPTFAYEKRLSRIETLRLAITYISFMDQVIRNEASTAVPPAKSTITPPNAAAAAPSCEPIVTSMLAPEHHQRRGDAQHFREASVCW